MQINLICRIPYKKEVIKLKNLIFLFSLIVLIGCIGCFDSGGDGDREDGNNNNIETNKWDEMKWDNGKWGRIEYEKRGELS